LMLPGTNWRRLGTGWSAGLRRCPSSRSPGRRAGVGNI
jgi:hypothetical protein